MKKTNRFKKIIITCGDFLLDHFLLFLSVFLASAMLIITSIILTVYYFCDYLPNKSIIRGNVYQEIVIPANPFKDVRTNTYVIIDKSNGFVEYSSNNVIHSSDTSHFILIGKELISSDVDL